MDVFTKMNKLRVLRFYFASIDGTWDYDLIRMKYNDWYVRCKLHLSGDLKFLSKNLCYLCWHGYPLKSLPSNFHPGNLVELDMRFSRLEQLWEGNKVYFYICCFSLNEL